MKIVFPHQTAIDATLKLLTLIHNFIELPYILQLNIMILW